MGMIQKEIIGAMKKLPDRKEHRASGQLKGCGDLSTACGWKELKSFCFLLRVSLYNSPDQPAPQRPFLRNRPTAV